LLPEGLAAADDDGLVEVARGQSEKSEYEILRDANIRRNRAVLEQLGLGGPSPGAAAVVKRRKSKKKERPSGASSFYKVPWLTLSHVETRRSARVAAIVKVEPQTLDDEYDDGYESKDQEAWESDDDEGHECGSEGAVDSDHEETPSAKKAKKVPPLAPTRLTFKAPSSLKAPFYFSDYNTAPHAHHAPPAPAKAKATTPTPDDDDLLEDE
jgi:hypothetical protein